MNNQEYEQKKRECWKKFCKSNELYGQVHVLVLAAFKYAFDRAYALGKQEIKQEIKQETDAETVISGWVARDSDGDLNFYVDKPKRENGKPYGKPSEWGSVNVMTKLSVASFPDLTWESEPQPVEIILKRKKKNL